MKQETLQRYSYSLMSLERCHTAANNHWNTNVQKAKKRKRNKKNNLIDGMECFVFKRIKINVFLWERKKETDRSLAGSDMTRPSEMFSIAYGVLRVVCSLVPSSEKPQCMRNMEKFLKRKKKTFVVHYSRKNYKSMRRKCQRFWVK